MPRLPLIAAVCCFLPQFAAAGPVEVPSGKGGPPVISPAASYDPVEHWEFGLETSALWSVGGGASPLHYVFLPQVVTVKTPWVMRRQAGEGVLVLRSRFSLLAEPVIEGPESYFIGLAAGGSLEWWNARRTMSLFLSAGGGIGWMDARGHEIEGGQGQDFNFNWYVHSGLRFMLAERLSASLGLCFQHLSNHGLDDINPGVNALGPTIGLAWHW